MKDTRLIEQGSSPDPAVRRAAVLLSSVRMPEPSADRRARVRRRMAAGNRGARVIRLVPAAIALVLMFGGVAGATWFAGVRRIERAEEPLPPPPPAPPPARRSVVPPETGEPSPPAERTKLSRVRRTLQAVPAPRPRAEPPVEVPAEPEVREEPAPPPGSLRIPERVDPPSPEDGAELVARAIELLRKERRPRPALRLLEQYRRERPRGMLAEEALALSIEAAAAFDPGTAARLATEYLARFPDGRFAEAARRARSKIDD